MIADGVTDLLVEHPVVFVDVGDVAFFFVVPFAGELALLVDTNQPGQQPIRNEPELEHALSVDLPNYTVYGLLRRLIIAVNECVGIAVEILGGELLLLGCRQEL